MTQTNQTPGKSVMVCNSCKIGYKMAYELISTKGFDFTVYVCEVEWCPNYGLAAVLDGFQYENTDILQIQRKDSGVGCICKCHGLPSEGVWFQQSVDCPHCHPENFDTETDFGSKPTPEEEWRKSFRDRFLMKDSDCTWQSYPDPEQIELFMSNLVAKTREETINSVVIELEDILREVNRNSSEMNIQKYIDHLTSGKHELKSSQGKDGKE